MKTLNFYQKITHRFIPIVTLFSLPFSLQAFSTAVVVDSTKPEILIPDRVFKLAAQSNVCGLDMQFTPAALQQNFGVELKTPCGYLSSNVQLASWGRWVKGVLVQSDGWVILSENRTQLEIRNVGRFRLVINLLDRCRQRTQDTLYFELEDLSKPTMLCESAINLTLPGASGLRSDAVTLDHEFFNKGSKDNCRISQYRVRRAFYPAGIPTMIEAGYDTNGDGKLDQQDGFDFNKDGDITDLGEYIERRGARYWTPLQNQVEFFPVDTLTSVSVELWGIDGVGAFNTCKTQVSVSSASGVDRPNPPLIQLPGAPPLSRGKDILHPNLPNPIDKEALIYYDLQQSGNVEFNVYDQQGRRVLTRQLNGNTGRNEILLQRHELGSSKGFFLYTLRTPNAVLVQKMLVL
ncbi:T9SS type A sorting domain-containing protein [Haliscomenobacter hydrossis]|uniref:Secretion system C-terminal sorting domain-containing protein n=1 Tax=Haliscomenobacter hydrossis (strain ATCC 27775 / DSM 1100 / LMG 10767 / O) TaxID=760192 RepID=F4KXW9_HALH1|nr:T9SS type A sorting domain-containing protein [Haliscomenobacter hydrossis]AEE52628.1 hypothetical protein Halhy_4795 [Haliscomenobacter hydrossis DSM 1100]